MSLQNIFHAIWTTNIFLLVGYLIFGVIVLGLLYQAFTDIRHEKWVYEFKRDLSKERGDDYKIRFKNLIVFLLKIGFFFLKPIYVILQILLLIFVIYFVGGFILGLIMELQNK
jgi:hypothetical protein